MHVYIGGASNGKREYVRNNLREKNAQDVLWVEGELPTEGSGLVVIAGLEKWLENTTLSEAEAVTKVMEIVETRNTIFILTDIGRGIVPMNAAQRSLRDTCGRIYQRLFAEADEVTRIWYGIAKNIKRGESS
ncbi:bifunctional adenosylcobinamide kinase/adenosylcobinamide-phosphate guanylyltransferase [Sporosarcina sp. G11-34]|uniref:bifunctional adenosylcobinamide kinase/adenosylcobinamide-phosphate guanylyltransferase n=1 Tax=Sporosarcina sp. G11-34 TaxID=2849605 RepID=UPI0022A961F0|nr:bifunctional adenosylcobinamide kinase/adenosylcobinamide-phosphate guanylyltransferase [Sporosarcina sp. G11-34]MCZ2257502.1 bifunctional adenosylcobinamide kinase/adenosylcobinamide-phosphate guanylyltransferase [Sporosarcina sp. G11-34]